MVKKASVVFGVVFLLVGLLGFVSNPIVGESSLFHTDLMHNVVHLLSGAVLLYAGLKTSAAALTLKVFGIVYLLVAVLGLLAIGESGMGIVLGFIEVNSADNWLHVLLGIIILLAGLSDDSQIAVQIN